MKDFPPDHASLHSDPGDPAVDIPRSAAESQTKRGGIQDLIDKRQVALFDAFDQLSRLGNANIEPPQLVVVGDQSSGKSSALEAIARFHFPVNDQLCTRFPTKLVLRRSSVERIELSIKPGDSRSAKDKRRLLRFHAKLSTPDEFAEWMKKAAAVIGVPSSAADLDNSPSKNRRASTKNFTDDVLIVEKHGPDLPLVDLLDLPGLFQSESNEQDKESKQTVMELVEEHVRSKRNLILLVVSARTSFHNHAGPAVLQSIAKKDPDLVGRVVGVLTSPDRPLSVSESRKLLRGDLNSAGLSIYRWHVLKNQGQNERNRRETLEQRDRKEAAFFLKDPEWRTVPNSQRGIGALKATLKDAFWEHTQAALPGLISEVDDRIQQLSSLLKAFGDARTTDLGRRRYLHDIAAKFEMFTLQACQGIYQDNKCTEPHEPGEECGDCNLKRFFPEFADVPGGKDKNLRAAVRALSRAFARAMAEYGKTKDVGKPDEENESGSEDESGKENESERVWIQRRASRAASRATRAASRASRASSNEDVGKPEEENESGSEDEPKRENESERVRRDSPSIVSSEDDDAVPWEGPESRKGRKRETPIKRGGAHTSQGGNGFEGDCEAGENEGTEECHKSEPEERVEPGEETNARSTECLPPKELLEKYYTHDKPEYVERTEFELWAAAHIDLWGGRGPNGFPSETAHHRFFEYQSKKWQSIAKRHLEAVWVVVERFTDLALAASCPNEAVREALRTQLVRSRLQKLKETSKGSLKSLLDCHQGGTTGFFDGFVDAGPILQRQEEVSGKVVAEIQEAVDGAPADMGRELCNLAVDSVLLQTGLGGALRPELIRGGAERLLRTSKALRELLRSAGSHKVKGNDQFPRASLVDTIETRRQRGVGAQLIHNVEIYYETSMTAFVGYVNALVVENGILNNLPKVILTQKQIMHEDGPVLARIAGEKLSETRQREKINCELETLKKVLETLKEYSTG